ncbi:MAG TPA: hypothetical protein VGI11_20295 [Variovorax sp.]
MKHSLGLAAIASGRATRCAAVPDIHDLGAPAAVIATAQADRRACTRMENLL